MNVQNQLWQALFDFVAKSDAEGLLAFLQNSQPINVIEVRDHLGFSLVNFACLKNETSCFKVLFEYSNAHKVSMGTNLEMRGDHTEKDITEWLSRPNQFGFVPMHWATQAGNYTMLTTMADKGNVDLHYKNKYGASFLHIAAQKNQPLSLYFFYSRGVDINVTDLFNFTPLHWACHC